MVIWYSFCLPPPLMLERGSRRRKKRRRSHIVGDDIFIDIEAKKEDNETLT
jgi:hypothetical protein